ERGLAAHAGDRRGDEHLRDPHPRRRAVAGGGGGHLRRPLTRRSHAHHSRRRAAGRRHLDLRRLARREGGRRRANPVRAFFRGLFGLVLRIFFRRIEISGLERVPREGPVIFVLNHPNGLIDPGFLLCLAPRRVSFLAKAPLFRMPVIGIFCRAFEAIPVHRRQDEGSDPSHNRETFETARAVLARGGAIAICPEGKSHSDPKLRPLKTGAARIALGAAAALTGPAPIRIVPAGLYYRAKRTVRYEAALAAAGLDPHHLTPQSFKLGRIARYVARAALYLLVLFPAAILGVALHYPAYRAVGFVAMGIAKGGEDTLATTKVLAAMVLFPLTWMAGVAVVWLWLGMNATLPAAIVLPLTGYAALIFFERLDRVVGGARALGLFVFRRRAFLRLLEEQRA